MNTTYRPRTDHTSPSGLPVRTCAVILDGHDMCLIRRRRPDGDQYSVPGGLVDPGEELDAALARELREELGLDLGSGIPEPQLRWVQDQTVTRPGADQPLRRLHLIHLIDLPHRLRHTLAAAEKDATDHNDIIWMHYRQAASVHLYPAVGPALHALHTLHDQTGPILLPAITDQTYRWH
ncbi:NUDIX hydrolase [Streptomyces sp. NPDC056672]|uniref:NUDIX hydrolase n=1 Tax=Streptomyces sp. NPDC056672 TaxID=3345906 RepID=UPI0036C112EA